MGKYLEVLCCGVTGNGEVLLCVCVCREGQIQAGMKVIVCGAGVMLSESPILCNLILGVWCTPFRILY